MGVIYQRKSSTALTPKEGTKNNYKQSLHSPFRTNFQRREMLLLYIIMIYLYSLKTWHEYYKQCYTKNLHTMMSF